uniref:DUF3530 family protein n=1 Tax=Ningiella ruwaisensis TaxID=2364274 RepID=UPI0010A068A7|nr:DUF3530 family protein [Ningiella ruwaisensis]
MKALRPYLHAVRLSIILCALIYFLSSLSVVKAQAPDDAQNDDTSKPVTEGPKSLSMPDFGAMTVDAKTRLPEGDFQSINITIDNQQYAFPIIITQANTPITKGSIVIIADAAQQSAQYAKFKALSAYLNSFGWHTLLIPAPKLEDTKTALDVKLAAITQDNAQNTSPVQSADEETDSNSMDAEQIPQVNINAFVMQSNFDESVYEIYEQFLQTLLNTVLKSAPTQGYRVFYANGLSALPLLKLAGDKLDADAIVLGNPYWPHKQINEEIAEKLAISPLPLLDVNTQQDNHWSQATQDMRLTQAKVKLKTHYRQRKIGLVAQSHILAEDIASEMQAYFSYLGW